ncbi:MAG: transglutaminase family protein [Silicimonas sp.]|nr:transglutaminase family protein [Silicimonas sp.]
MRLEIHHTTRYNFDPPMRGVAQSLRLWPSEFEGQTTIDWSVKIDSAVRGADFRDGAGDRIETAVVMGPVEQVVVHVEGTVETTDLSGVLKGHRERVKPLVYLRSTRFTKPDTALRDLARDTVKGIDTDLEQAHALAVAISEAIRYTPGKTDPETSGADALAAGEGVCQDHAHALIGAALSLDIPARYVTGYLYAEGGIAEASHAWAELHLPDLGWVGFDASNGVCPNEHYVRIGSGYDAVDAAPIRGVAQGVGTEGMDVDVSVVEAAQ